MSGFGNSSVRSVAVDPVYPHIVYAQVDDRAIYKSTDSGATWNTGGSTGLPQSGLSNRDTLIINPLNTSILYVGSTRNGVYQSTDGGLTWFKSSAGMRAGLTIRNLVISHSDPNILFAASTIENTYRSADGGANWKLIGTDGLAAGSIVNALAVDPSDPSVVYLATESSQQTAWGVFKSIDSGASWKRADSGLGFKIHKLIIEDKNPNVLYAVANVITEGQNFVLYKTVDGGANWSLINNYNNGRLNKLIIDPAEPSTIYLAGSFFVSMGGSSSTAGVYKSTAGGANSENTGLDGEAFALAIDSSGRHLYAGTPRGVFSYHYTTPEPGPVPVPDPTVSPTPVVAGPNELVSVNREETDSGNGSSRLPQMTPDGRYVVFSSSARDLTSDLITGENIFVRDMQTGATELVSVNAAGTGSAGGFSYSPAISDDGRYVAFTSNASDLVGNDTNRNTDVFVRDRQTGTTELVSVNSAGKASGNSQSDFPAITSDGRYVLFISYATDLVSENDATGIFGPDVFVRDRQTGTTRLVSINSAGTASGAGNSLSAKITPDGRYVAFLGYAGDLVANVSDVNDDLDVFVRDMQTATTTLVSVNDAGTGSGNRGSGFGFNITPDGRYVVFGSDATDLVAAPADANRRGDIYVRDLQTGQTELASINRDGTSSGNGVSFEPGITPDGRYIIFKSQAGDLVENDDGNGEDIFVRDTQTNATELVSVNRAGVGNTDGAANNTSFSRPPARITPDGRYVAFVSAAVDLTGESDIHGTNDIFVRDRQSGATKLVTVSTSPEASGNGDSQLRQISADGRYVLFSSISDNLAAPDTNGLEDVFRYDAQQPGTLQFSAPAFQQNEDGGHAVVTVTRTGGTSGAVSVTLSTGTGGTASAGVDYTAVSQAVAFADGETGSKTINIPIIDDALVEGSETVALTLDNPTGGAVLGSPATTLLTITDNDTCGYSISPSSRAARPAGETFTVNVTAQSGCAWAAASNSNFINVTSGASGSGDGVVTLIALSNGSGVPRTGTVTIAGQTLTVTQSELIPEVAILDFTQSGYAFSEDDDRAILSIRRTGDVSGAASVDYRTSDTDTFSVGCADNANNRNGAFGRCDFATTVGRINFAPFEQQKTITVPLIDDGHDEVDETFQVGLSNPAGATLGVTTVATVIIQDNDAAGAPNPVITSPQFFVRQQYLDFLSREPDAGGFNAWLGVLGSCQNIFTPPNVPSNCDRIYVSGEGFFRSLEFQLKGAYVFRFYKLAFGRLPEYTEIVADMSFVAGQTAEEVYARKAQLAQRFTERAEFQTAYGGLPNSDYVFALLARSGLPQVTTPDPANPDGTRKVTLTGVELTRRLDAGTLTRAQVFRAIADSDEVGAAEFNNAFVAMQYYGYLRRKPDDAGFRAWLAVLQRGDVRTMIDGFLNSAEYKLRFGRS
ncbi:MAG TPA: Calx-beta domain-containing protein [Pyrinomonadaceae bacterium]